MTDRYDGDDEYFNDQDDDGYSTMDYVKFVRNNVKLTKDIKDKLIIKKLIEFEYDVDTTADYFKKKQQTTNSLQSSTSNTKAISATNNNIKANTNLKNNSSSSITNKEAIFKIPENIDIVTDNIITSHNRSDELQLSDNENITILQSIDRLALNQNNTNSITSTNSTTIPTSMTMIVTGHVDAGKSTIVGHLLYKCGLVSQRTVHKYEKESKAIGKASFSLAWITDESSAEREHGITINLTERLIKTPSKLITVIDSPGHKDYIPTMIKGAAQADAALLVVPATVGEFESSMKDNAQTREHAILLKALGVSQILVAVNKMDGTLPQPWSRERFQYIEATLRRLLCDEMDFPDAMVRFIPVSGITGQNLIALDESCPLKIWYQDMTLLEGIESFQVNASNMLNTSLRAVINEVISTDCTKGKYEVDVKVLQGSIELNRTIGFYMDALINNKLTTAANNYPIELRKDSDINISTSNSNNNTSRYVFKVNSIQKSSLSIDANTNNIDSNTTSSSTSTTTTILKLNPGERGTLHLSNMYYKGDTISLKEGSILFKGPTYPSRCKAFQASITTMAMIYPPIIPGSCYELYLHGVEAFCMVKKLHSVTISNEFETKKIKHPKCISNSSQATITIVMMTEYVIIEPFHCCNILGRFTIRSKGKTIAFGICEKILE